MELVSPRTTLYVALAFVAMCPAIAFANTGAVFPFYALKLEAQAIAAGQPGAIPVEMPSEIEIELVGTVLCDSTVAQVQSRTGKRGWIPINNLPPGLLTSSSCATETANKSLEQTRVGKPPLAAQLQRWAAKLACELTHCCSLKSINVMYLEQ